MRLRFKLMPIIRRLSLSLDNMSLTIISSSSTQATPSARMIWKPRILGPTYVSITMLTHDPTLTYTLGDNSEHHRRQQTLLDRIQAASSQLWNSEKFHRARSGPLP